LAEREREREDGMSQVTATVKVTIIFFFFFVVRLPVTLDKGRQFTRAYQVQRSDDCVKKRVTNELRRRNSE
jgi:hypothetical protein